MLAGVSSTMSPGLGGRMIRIMDGRATVIRRMAGFRLPGEGLSPGPLPEDSMVGMVVVAAVVKIIEGGRRRTLRKKRWRLPSSISLVRPEKTASDVNTTRARAIPKGRVTENGGGRRAQTAAAAAAAFLCSVLKL